MATRVETLTPNGTVSNAWTLTGASAHAALSDASDATFIESSTNGQACELDLSSYTLQPGEFVSGVKVRVRCSTPTGNHAIGVRLRIKTTLITNVGGVADFFGTELLSGVTSSLASVSSMMRPGSGDPFAADAGERGAMGQTMIDNLQLGVVLWELAAEAGLSKVTEAAVDLYISTRQPTVSKHPHYPRLHFSDGTEPRFWGTNYRTSLFHFQPASRIITEMDAMRQAGWNLFRIHVETTLIKTGTGSTTWILLEMAKLVEVLQWMNDNGCYADLTLNADYSSNQAWYEGLAESARWDEQRFVCRKIAGMFVGHPAVAYICLINEGAAPSGNQTFYRLGDTTGSDKSLFVEWLTKVPGARSTAQIWDEWIDDKMDASDGLRFVNPDVVVVGSGSFDASPETIRPAQVTNGMMGLDAVYPHLYPSAANEWQSRMIEERSFGTPVVFGEFFWSGGGYHPQMAAVVSAEFDASSFTGHGYRTSAGFVQDDAFYIDNVRFHAPNTWLRLHETSGTVAEDSSLYPYGGPNDGTVTNTPTLGGPGQGMTFNAAESEWVSLATLTVIATNFLNSSYEAWVKTTSTAQGTVWGTFSTGTIGAAALYVNRANNGGTVAGSIECQLRGANAGNVVASTGDIDINDGNWHHVVLVITGATTVQFYVDGAAVTPTYHVQQTMTAPTFDFGMGVGALNLRGTISTFMTGSLRDVAFYPRRLTAGEVDAHYKAGVGQQTLQEAILVASQAWFEERAWTYRQKHYSWSRAGSRRTIQPRLGARA